MNYFYLIIYILLISSCEEPHNRNLEGFSKKKFEYAGKLKPKSIKNYPAKIDSLVFNILEKEYNSGFTKKVFVSHSLLFNENEKGVMIAYLDTLNYTVLVDVHLDSKKVDQWKFEINKQLKVISFNKT